MSRRLGGALVRHIELLRGASKFVRVEGVPVSLAQGMVAAWNDELLPPLRVVSGSPTLFGARAMSGASGSKLRNSSPKGYILVVCEGSQVADRNSVAQFESVSPADLLDSPEGIAHIAAQHPAVPLDGSARAVKEAISRSRPSERPSARAVSEYFDRVAGGEDPLAALPTLGAFADNGAGVRVDGDRIGENLKLAARRTSEDLLKPSAYTDIRQRAKSVLGRREAWAGRPDVVARAVEDVISDLQSGSDRLLSRLVYDEAREVFEQKTLDLAAAVIAELRDYRSSLEDGSQTADLPWDSYIRDADGLRRSADQRQVARSLIELDDSLTPRVFLKRTRTKLERLLRDRAISAGPPSCPELAIVRAIGQLGTPVAKVQLVAPLPPSGSTGSRTAAGATLTLAVARLRLGALLRHWESQGAEISGALLNPATDNDPLDSFVDADWTSRSPLPALQLRIYGSDATVQVDWKPDLDDLGVLKACLLFADVPTLTLHGEWEPTLGSFVSGELPAPVPVPSELSDLAVKLNSLARQLLERGLEPAPLTSWAEEWALACEELASVVSADVSEKLALAGAVTGEARTVALSPLAPLKAEWLSQYLAALWEMLERTDDIEADTEPIVQTATGVAGATASHYPAHLRLRTRDRVLLPTSEGRIWSTFGSQDASDASGYGGFALTSVLERLLLLQPEAASHLRCLAWGPGAADLLIAQAVPLIGRRVGRAVVGRVEIFCVGQGRNRPSAGTLTWAETELKGGREQLQLRYVDDLDHARAVLGGAVADVPAVHLALVTGLTDGGQRLTIETPEVEAPAIDAEVLFVPRTWQRARSDRRTLLMPPSASDAGYAWLRLQNAIDEDRNERGEMLRVPEIRTGTLDLASELREIHDLALWVATLDRYATRDSLEQALGSDNVAILHQERRLGGDSPLSLVLSQKSGGPTDRAIGRSLRTAGIVENPDLALSIGTDIRKVASQGYGILALQAATSGAGINELVGHVVAFSLLANTTTPWPLPPGCRVLLVSLDEYRHWFPGKRADLFAIALDRQEAGVHIAAIEVKARRSDETEAAGGALDQLIQTLAATKWAAYPVPDSLHSRLWLNRIAEAAYSVARESRFKLHADEIAALENFRKGTGTLEWAGVGLVFGPNVQEFHRHYPHSVSGDIVPIAMHGIRLTESLLRAATSVRLTDLRTVEAERPPLQGGRMRRRPESQSSEIPVVAESTHRPEVTEVRQPFARPDSIVPSEPDTETTLEAPADDSSPLGTGGAGVSVPSAAAVEDGQDQFSPPILGWDTGTGEAIRWHPAGAQQDLQNGHIEIWGASGMGKTQFTMSLLAQLANRGGTHFGIADFKNDYSAETGFPQSTGAQFLDLWTDGASYNPLALYDEGERVIETAVIEIRDTIEEALRNLGRRQRSKLESALKEAFDVRRTERRWPTMLTLNDALDEDLAGILGDLTGRNIFRDGPPLGEVVDTNVIFGLSRIPGNGQTTVLAAAFILSSVLLKIQSLPPVPNRIRYMCVVDEAHRVADFRAVETMIREGRSKGLGVLLATQQPLDLPDIVAGNAQTKICFGLPDATVATMAARRLDPDNPRLPEQIRTLGVGEALVGLRGKPPLLLRMAQLHSDSALLDVPPLGG